MGLVIRQDYPLPEKSLLHCLYDRRLLLPQRLLVILLVLKLHLHHH